MPEGNSPPEGGTPSAASSGWSTRTRQFRTRTGQLYNSTWYWPSVFNPSNQPSPLLPATLALVPIGVLLLTTNPMLAGAVASLTAPSLYFTFPAHAPYTYVYAMSNLEFFTIIILAYEGGRAVLRSGAQRLIQRQQQQQQPAATSPTPSTAKAVNARHREENEKGMCVPNLFQSLCQSLRYWTGPNPHPHP